jgi:hypothetical protein
MDELLEWVAEWVLWPWNWGGSGRGSGWSMGKKGTARGKRAPRVRGGESSRVIYCGSCGTSGEHLTVAAVRHCYGRPVSEGPDFGYVRGQVKKV